MNSINLPCRINGFDFMVKQLEYELRTVEQVLKLKEDGLLNREIAEIVGVSVSEVGNMRPKRQRQLEAKLYQYKLQKRGVE